MSHRHFCDAAGHDWYYDGKALRPDAGGTEPSVCMCLPHHLPMEEGGHSSCPVELLACPEHRDEQKLRMEEAAGTLGPDGADSSPEPWTDKDGNAIVGFCLWCNCDFYAMDEMWAHNANSSAACKPFQQFKATQSESPSTPNDAEPLDDGESQ
jgi:hypothetical protein